jgi:uncharacterized membrane protein HdeD (DUF308 family)
MSKDNPLPSEGDFLLDSFAPFVNEASRTGVLSGASLIAPGIVSLLLPGLTAMATGIWLAVIFLLVGGNKMGQMFQNRARGWATYDLLWRAICLLGGLLLLLAPRTAVIILALILGLIFVIEGIGRISLATATAFYQASVSLTPEFCPPPGTSSVAAHDC